MKWENKPKVDVLIPVYRPDGRFGRLLQMLGRQTYKVNQIIVINTEKQYWDEGRYKAVPGLEVHHISKYEFDHGAARNLAAGYSGADVMIFMTDDAVPGDRYLVERLVEALEKEGPEGETIAMAYARQVPDKGCRAIERYTRAFNYPREDKIKTLADLPGMGIKTYFASNVCCAYRKDIFEKIGGFGDRAIFNEDMVYAAGAVKAGYAIAYAAKARVIHSHNLTFKGQFQRNFDLAVSQAQHPEVFAGLPSEGEGIRLVKDTARWLFRTGRFWLIPVLVVSSGCKYMGYRMGKQYSKLPRSVILRCTANREYWG
ncbi:MAG: glycosyltransferase family 2 protein [Hungatella sp.]|nr:glycosyltransferase family 2 protein [Hungatella sp.]